MLETYAVRKFSVNCLVIVLLAGQVRNHLLFISTKSILIIHVDLEGDCRQYSMYTYEFCFVCMNSHFIMWIAPLYVCVLSFLSVCILIVSLLKSVCVCRTLCYYS